MNVRSSPNTKASPPTPAPQHTWESLNLRDDVMKAIAALGLKRPLEIQAAAIPQILSGKDVLVASETGSGKTLTYALPIAHMIRRNEVELGILRKVNHPHALILLPNRELAAQVLGVFKTLSFKVHFKTVAAVPGLGSESEMDGDVLVATPGRLQQLQQSGSVSLSDVKYVVVDEADTMFDPSFKPMTTVILSACKREFLPVESRGNHTRSAQIVFTGATLSKELVEVLERQLPAITTVSTKGLHKPPATLRQSFIRGVGPDSKPGELIKLLSTKKWRKMIIFCNTTPTCIWLTKHLLKAKIETIPLHGELHAEERRVQYHQFKNAAKAILLCTDIAARGIDLDVDCVVMYDFPHSRSEYLHRIGRTARAGKAGEVVCLMSKKDDQSVHELKLSLKKDEALVNFR